MIFSTADLRRELGRAACGKADRGQASPGVTQTTSSRRPDDRVTTQRLQWERHLSRAAIVVTLVVFCVFLAAFSASAEAHLRALSDFVKAATFVMIVALLVYGGLVYLCARLGYMCRRTSFRHAS